MLGVCDEILGAPSACPGHSTSSASAWSTAKGTYQLCSSYFQMQNLGPCQRWGLTLATVIIVFFSMNVKSSLISLNNQSSICVGLAGGDWAACNNQRETVIELRPKNQHRILIPSRLIWQVCYLRADLCHAGAYERFVGRLGNISVGHPDWYNSEKIQDKHSECISSLVLQIPEIDSLVWTTHI